MGGWKRQMRNLRVEASNAELSISLKLDHDLNAAVSPTVLAKFLARVDGENTTIAEHGSGALLFKSGRQRVTLPTWSLEDAPSGFWPESAGTPSDNAYTPEGSVTDEEWASFVGVVWSSKAGTALYFSRRRSSGIS